MEGYEWAKDNLGGITPNGLAQSGVVVHLANEVLPWERLVDLETGRVVEFEVDNLPTSGYYADFGTFERYCRENGVLLSAEDGALSALPMGFDGEGTPLTDGRL